MKTLTTVRVDDTHDPISIGCDPFTGRTRIFGPGLAIELALSHQALTDLSKAIDQAQCRVMTNEELAAEHLGKAAPKLLNALRALHADPKCAMARMAARELITGIELKSPVNLDVAA
jgi:hypothetical protein